LVGKPHEKTPLVRPKPTWEDNIKIGRREIEWESVDLVHPRQDRDRWWAVMNTVMNLMFHKWWGISGLIEHTVDF
jgi:hypothetical protein